MNKTIKCLHCNKVFFKFNNDKCPFCGKNLNDIPDILRDIFKTGDK